jgi:hypothetical protein
MGGLSTPPYTKRIAGAAPKTRPIGLRSCCSTHCGISGPLALLFCPTRAVLPQTPTPQTHRISVGRALKTRDLQTFTISARPRPLPPGLHSPAGAPSRWAMLPSPARSLLCPPSSKGLHSPAGALLHWAMLPSSARSLLCLPHSQGLHSPAGARSHWATVPSPE